MTEIFANIEIKNYSDLFNARRLGNAIESIPVEKIQCRVLPDVSYLFINEEIKQKLNLPFFEKRTFEIVDQERIELEMVGPIELECLGQRTTTQAVVLPGNEQPMIGGVALFALHLTIEQDKNRLVVDPKPSRI